MLKCMVCDNTSENTKIKRPVVLYHRFPKNEYIKRKWLKVFGIDHCHDGQRICSDHFLKENYRRKPGKRRFLLYDSVPQPYDRNGFPSNYATQSNDVETGNNVILPMEQNILRKLASYDESDYIESEFYREEHIENAAVNNFKSPGRSSRLSRNNEDITDHTLGSGLRCSVKNCFNKHSVNLSLFGYPKDFSLRKKWIEKCGLQKDPTKIVKRGTRVCSTHFDLECFKNTNLKNRLKPGAVPSLFLDNDNTSMTIDLTDDSSNSSRIEDFTKDIHGLIFKMSKEVKLPNLFWKSEHLSAHNATRFYERDTQDVAVKKVIFYNNLVPTIEIYGKKYEHKKPITTMKELDDLLNNIDSIVKCYGRGGFVFEQCLGYFENNLHNMCTGCQGLVKDRDLQRMKAKIDAKNNTLENYKKRIAEKTAAVVELRRRMAEMRNPHRTLDL